jgi:hypothetical protein
MAWLGTLEVFPAQPQRIEKVGGADVPDHQSVCGDRSWSS